MDIVLLSIINITGSVVIVALLFTGCADLKVAKEAFKNRNYALAEDNYKELSDRGFPRAHKGMGDLSLHNNPHNTQIALDYYMRAYEGGYEYAASNIAKIMLQHAQTQEDYRRVIDWFNKAVAAGSIAASYELAILKLEGNGIANNVTTGLSELNILASNGYVNAHIYLASIYHNGIYLDRSDEKAIEHYKNAYSLGREDALLKSAGIYADNESPLYDKLKAISIYRSFSSMGYGFASYQMAKYYSATHNESSRWYRKSATQGYSQGRLKYALIRLEGIYITQNIPLALKELNDLVSEGYLNANLSLGNIYHSGMYVRKDERKALDYYEQPIKQGELRAFVYAANVYAEHSSAYADTTRAIKFYKNAFELSEAKYFLGILYESEGKIKQAIAAYRLSAEQSYLPAVFVLATMDESRSIKIIEDLSEKSYAPASSYLANLYKEGRYVLKDEVKALTLYDLAYSQGDKLSQLMKADLLANKRSVVYQPLAAEQIYLSYAKRSHKEGMYKLALFYEKEESLNEKSFKWYLRASELGSRKSRLRLADMKRDGEYLPYDIEQALQEYIALGNFAYAKNRIAQLYLEGHGVRFNANTAIVYLKQAYASGMVSADLTRAFVLYNGIGVKAQPVVAIKIYQKHALASNAKAAYELASIYELKPSKTKAIYWYEKAVVEGSIPANYRLAIMLKKTNPDRSIALLQYASSMGNTKAQLEYAKNIFYGNQMKKNEFEGLKMVFAAIQNGEIKAINIALDLISDMKNKDDATRAYLAAKE